jgi:hypothetical protein
MAPLPTTAEALYEPAFANGDRKACLNCGLFVDGSGAPTRCVVHGARAVHWSDICGYHVPGLPMGHDVAALLRVRPVDPVLTGITSTLGGASCDRCVYFSPGEPGQGACAALHLRPTVAARGCCARYERATSPDGQA